MCGNQVMLKKIILLLVIILTPTVITLVLVYWSFQTTIFSMVPYWNDEVKYWHQILTFTHVGFEGGHYTVGERPAFAKFTHFGPHGPTFPMLYGIAGKIFGWQFYTGIIINLILITLSLSFFLYISKLKLSQLFLLEACILTFYPMLLFIPTNMQESLHQSIAIILGGIFYVLFSKNGNIATIWKIVILLFIIVAMLIRPTWSVLLIPFFIIISPKKSNHDILIACLLGCTGIFIEFLVTQYMHAYYPNSLLGPDFLKNFLSDPIDVALLIIRNKVLINAKYYIPQRNIITLLVYQTSLFIFVLWVWNGITIIKKHFQRYNIIAITTENLEFIFHTFNITFIFLINMIFNQYYGLYRAVAPHVLLTILILIALQKRTWLIGLIILSNIIILPRFVQLYQDFHKPRFVYDEQIFFDVHHNTKDILVYEEDVDPWCNTLLLIPPPEVEFYRSTLGIPSGIGISIILFGELALPPKSKYILLGNRHYGIPQESLNIRLLNTTSFGNIYHNLDANCD